MTNKKSCLNCRNYEPQGLAGYCNLLHKNIANPIIERPCFYAKGEHITCPYCKTRVVMDWRCSACGCDIAYDIDDNGVRSNPHKMRY